MWAHWSRGVVVSVLAGGCCVGAVAAVTGASRSGSSPSKPPPRAIVAAADANAAGTRALEAAMRIAPANGAAGVAPDGAVVVVAPGGQVASVRVASSQGAIVGGMFAPSGTLWHSTGPLDYGTTYRVVADARGAARSHVRLTSTFRTLTPATTVHATAFPSEGLDVGVGQPIVLRFDHFIDSAAAQTDVVHHLVVSETRPVVGGWHWFSNDELHFRPQRYWPAGEHVNVSWDLRDWNAGNGMWGDGSGTVHFTVGDAHVSFADLSTHKMTVTDNGRVIATYPISGGKPADPTMDGVHIVLDRASVVRMVSSTNGIPVNSPDGYDELVYSDVHISDSGEYVHAAPWSVGSQGVANVSHGCINLSPANAGAFFAFSHVGDVVLVGGGPRPPAPGDHGVMDWDTAWSAFTPANVVLRVPAALAGLR